MATQYVPYVGALVTRAEAKAYHKDHIVPLARGGANWIANIQLTCPKCNFSKNRSDPIDFAKKLGKLLWQCPRRRYPLSLTGRMIGRRPSAT
jgi:hypothetical protein